MKRSWFGMASVVAVFTCLTVTIARAGVIDLKDSDAAKEIQKLLHDHVSQGNERSERVERLEFDTGTKEFRGKIVVRHRHRIIQKKNVLGKPIIIADITVYDLTQSAEFKYNLVKNTGDLELNLGTLPGGQKIRLRMEDIAKLPSVAKLK